MSKTNPETLPVSTRCKVYVKEVVKTKHQEIVTIFGVCYDETEENRKFAKASPSIW